MSKTKLNIIQVVFLICCIHASAQIPQTKLYRPINEDYFYYSVDTLKFESPAMKIVYNLESKMGLESKVLDFKDSIFSKDFNSFSVMHLNPYNQKTIKVPTIPIDNVVIDDSLGLILCLSRAMVSPYQIVLYDFNGDLLFKKKITSFELQLDSISFMQFKDLIPDFYRYAVNNHEIYKNDNVYYIDLGY